MPSTNWISVDIDEENLVTITSYEGITETVDLDPYSKLTGHKEAIDAVVSAVQNVLDKQVEADTGYTIERD